MKALSADGDSWLLLNASPDIGDQVRANPALHARRGATDTPVKAVVLMYAQIWAPTAPGSTGTTPRPTSRCGARASSLRTTAWRSSCE